MMTLQEKATIMHYHRHRAATHAHGSVEALGWLGTTSQQRRFEALCGISDFSGKTVLDVGCGYGDLKSYLDRHFHGFCYIGIDQMADFVTEARARHGHRPECYFCIADATTAELPVVDFVLASGLLSYRTDEADFGPRMLERLFACAREGLAFNMLDAGKFPDHPLLVGHDCNQVLAWCREMTPNVRLVDGYLEDDFTVMMRRSG